MKTAMVIAIVWSLVLAFAGGLFLGAEIENRMMWHNAIKNGAAIETIVDHKIVHSWREYHNEGYRDEGYDEEEAPLPEESPEPPKEHPFPPKPPYQIWE